MPVSPAGHRTLFGSACAALAMAACPAPACAQPAGEIAAYRVVGDGTPEALASPGNAERGRRLALDRNGGACVLCHVLPEPNARFMGTLGPPLTGVGSRYTAAQLRLRIVDSTRVKPEAAMPPYYRTEGLRQVAAQYAGKAVLSAQQVEDVVAYLEGLQ